MEQTKKPIDLQSASLNQILQYEIESVMANRYQDEQWKKDKVALLKSQMVKN